MIGSSDCKQRLLSGLKTQVPQRMRAICSFLVSEINAGRVLNSVMVVSIAFLGSVPRVTQTAQACLDKLITETGKIPLPDLGLGTYEGSEGGLYPGGSSIRPVNHLEAGVRIAESLVPLGVDGSQDPVAGKLVMISVGMSNANMMFAGAGGPDNIPVSFMTRAAQDPSTNPKLELVNGAQGGGALEQWIDPAATYWDNVDSELADRGLTPEQVQVAWVKLMAHDPGGEFPDGARMRQGHFEAVAENLVIRYPNIRLAYFSTRTFSVAPVLAKGEPHTYEDGYAVKWMIERQLERDLDLNFDPARGELRAPWLSWGPYLWTDGLNPRSDGLVWQYGDSWQHGDQGCSAHPNIPGLAKNAAQLHAFFKTDPTTVPWFLRSTLVSHPPESVYVSASPASGDAPLTVEFQAGAVDPDGQILEIVWTFGDGTFSYNPEADPNDPLNIQNNPNPTKTYYMPGSYPAYVTITDSSGNTVHQSIQVVVEGEPVIRSYESPSDGQQAEALGSVVLTATVDQTGEVSLQWHGESVNTRGFKLERSQPPDGGWIGIANIRPNVLNYVDDALTPSTQYSYRLRLSNAGTGVFSNVVSVVTPAKPPSTEGEQIEGREVELQDPSEDQEQPAALDDSTTASNVSIDITLLVVLSLLAGAGLAFSATWLVGRTRRE